MIEMADDDALKTLAINTKSATDKKFKLSPDDAMRILSRISAKD